MTDTRYRVRLPDGQVFDKHATPEKIRRRHPDAMIEGRVVIGANGIGTVAAFHGEQPVEKTERLQGEQQDSEAPDYDAMTVAQLQAILTEREIEVGAGAKKADLVEILQVDDNPEGE